MILQEKLDEKTLLNWAEFGSDNNSVLTCTEFLRFLDLQARHLECVSHVGHKHDPGFDRTCMPP